MIVKVFDFSVRLDVPIPRAVKAKGRVYVVKNGKLAECQGVTRTFNPSEDALHFDIEFGDTLQLSIADVAHGISLTEFDCKVTVCEVEGTVLKLYHTLDNNILTRLVLIFEQRGGEAVKRYAWSIVSKTEWRSRKSEIAQQLGVHEREVDKLIEEWQQKN